jgi:hypothetical protein
MPRNYKYVGLTKKKGGNDKKRTVRIRKYHQKGGLKDLVKKDRKNCHPSVVDKTVSSDSCLTPSVVENIKKEYNENVSSEKEKITENEPSQIYAKLLEKGNCNDDECLVKQVLPTRSGSKKMKEMVESLEAPKQPMEWKLNPNEWLSNFDIDKVMNQYKQTYPEFMFLSPSPIDFDSMVDGTCVTQNICSLRLSDLFSQRVPKRKIGLVFNLSKHSDPGTHWVSLFLHFPSIPSLGMRKKKDGWKEKCVPLEKKLLEKRKDEQWTENTPYAFFFDSTGSKIPEEIEELVCRLSMEWEKIKPSETLELQYDDNHKKGEHQQGNNECGMYSLFFIVTMLTGFCGGKVVTKLELKKPEVCPLNKTFQTEQEKREYFQSDGQWEDKTIPDDFVAQFRNIYFNK